MKCRGSVDTFKYTLAMETALFLAEVLFRHTLAMKTALFLAVCSDRAAMGMRCLAGYFR